MDYCLMSAEESTALPTPASSDCSSAFSHPGAISAPSRTKVSRQPVNEHEAVWSRISKEMFAQSMAEDIEPVRKGPVYPVRTSTTPAAAVARPSSKPGEEPAASLKSCGGQSSTRSRSAGKSSGSRSNPRTPVGGKSYSPVRSGSPTDRAGAAFGSRVPRTRGSGGGQIAGLEKELQDSQRARSALTQQLEEERSRAVADRAQLTRLASRIEQLESSREVNAALLEDNRFLRAELEAEKLQVQEMALQCERLQGEVPPPTVVLSTSQEKLLEENEKLRNDLKQSQVMLAKYTEELSMIMPDVELILTQWKSDSTKGPEGTVTAVAPPGRAGVGGSARSGRTSTGATPPAPSSPGGGGRDLPAAPWPVAAGSQQAEDNSQDRYVATSSPAGRTRTPITSSAPRQRATSPNGGAASGGRSTIISTRPRSIGRGSGTGGGGGVRVSTSPPPPKAGTDRLSTSQRSNGARQGKGR